jgi:hypothetical protein
VAAAVPASVALRVGGRTLPTPIATDNDGGNHHRRAMSNRGTPGRPDVRCTSPSISATSHFKLRPEHLGDEPTPTDDDVGNTIDVVVKATNSVGNASATSSNTGSVVDAPAPTNTAVPTVSGTAQVGQTLTTTHRTWSGLGQITYTHQWQDCDSGGNNCTNISGAASSIYTVVAGDVGHTIESVVTATN